ncbi:MAG: hypothetical protein JW841_07960, partial [Deltaproteobacteria bacterium]|nr:hypothetical protein [Deltaproteobacteria bacterium]
MELLFNELSLHGQFHDIASFKNAIKQLMQLRVCARKFGREVYCQRYGLQNLQITRTEKLQQILSLLNRDQKIAITSWMDRNGPFLEDIRQHSEDDYLSYNDIIVTNNAIGEAAWCMLHDIDRKLVSLAPSNWLITPISITWINDSNITQIANVENYWEVDTLQSMLTLIEPPIRSWIQLEDRVRRRYDSLFFADNAFEPIRAYPFVSHVAERVLFICNILNRFKNCFSYDGKRTPEGNKIYQDF